MNAENYKKIYNSQKLSVEINERSKYKEYQSSSIEEFATSKPELITELYNRLNNEERAAEILNIIENIDEKKNIENLFQALDRENRRKRIFKLIRVSASVASAVLFISFMIWQSSSENNIALQRSSKTGNESLLNPVLKLSSGKVYELISDENRATGKDVNYIVEENSKVNIEDFKNEIYGDSVIKNNTPLYLELTVPKTSSYTVVLSDGSEVILNANSSIVYPEVFTSDKREVTIKGEAYFNVKKSSSPFIVKTENSYIKVYGTSFNVNARDTNNVKTTLLDGVVGVGALGITEQILKPNQMAVIQADSKTCTVQDIDANNSIGWITGSIICLDGTLGSLINDLEAWYGVDIRHDENRDEIENKKINILIKHSMEINEVLKLIEDGINVKFINEGGYYSIDII